MDFLTLIYVALGSYLCGSLPTAYLAGRLIKGVDIRTIGSGNVGASNAMRLLGKGWGITVLLIDALKGLIPVLIIMHVYLVQEPNVLRYAMLGALACMIGHIFPVWLQFKGGKGVATGMGVMVALIPLAVAIVLPVFVLIVYVSRFISLGSVVAAMLLPVAFFINHDLTRHGELFGFIAVACIFVIYKHKSNIRRIIAGTENRLGERKDP